MERGCVFRHTSRVFSLHIWAGTLCLVLSVTAVTQIIPINVLSACFSVCPHSKGLALSCTSSSSMAKTEGNHFFPDVRSVKMECCPEVMTLASCVLGEFSWGPEHLCKREAVLLPLSRVLVGDCQLSTPIAFCKALRVADVTLADFADDLLRDSVYIYGDFSPARFGAPE